jgi:aryl-alcohol dehydrogenase-like predicted oxidoreductase
MNRQLRPLGKSGINISPIGLGAWQFSQANSFNRFIWRALPESDQDAIVQASLNGGVNWFDTAETYGFGRSERGLSKALQHAGAGDDEIVMATKWNPLGRRAGSITKTIYKRMDNLFPYSIDLYQVHNPYSFSSPESEMDHMAGLVNAGKVKTIGVSNFSAAHMLRAHSRLQSHGLPLASNQVKYSLLDRKIESNGVLEAARALGITIIAYTPLEWGLLSGKFHDNPELIDKLPLARRLYARNKLESTEPLIAALKEIGGAYEATSAQVALNWIISYHGEAVVAIPGASKARHARDNAAAMAFSLSDGEMDELDRLTRPSA